MRVAEWPVSASGREACARNPGVIIGKPLRMRTTWAVSPALARHGCPHVSGVGR
jgi:hypothetical protein